MNDILMGNPQDLKSKEQEKKMTATSNFTIAYYYYPQISKELIRITVVLLKF